MALYSQKTREAEIPRGEEKNLKTEKIIPILHPSYAVMRGTFDLPATMVRQSGAYNLPILFAMPERDKMWGYIFVSPEFKLPIFLRVVVEERVRVC